MAQDFYQAFGVGTDEKYISIVDINGIALAVIQGVNEIVQDQASQIATQQQQIAALKDEIGRQRTQITSTESRLAALERNQSTVAAAPSPESTNWLVLAAAVLIGLFELRHAAHQRGKVS